MKARHPLRYVSRLTKGTLAIILAGGRGERLKQLTLKRAKPATPFGGKYRIIDFPLSNCINSGVRRMGVLTQYKAHSLIRHLQRGWSFFRAERNESLDILPASQQLNNENWYKGTADAVTQNIDIIEGYGPKYIIILAGDHIYKQDYSLMIQHHVKSGADVTVGCIEVPRMEATGFGVMKVGDKDKILDFVEKPADPPGIPGDEGNALASMGIYVFKREVRAAAPLPRFAEDVACSGADAPFPGSCLCRSSSLSCLELTPSRRLALRMCTLAVT